MPKRSFIKRLTDAAGNVGIAAATLSPVAAPTTVNAQESGNDAIHATDPVQLAQSTRNIITSIETALNYDGAKDHESHLTEREIKEHGNDLSSSEFSTRQEKTRALINAGFAARPHVRTLLTHDDPEVRIRAQTIMQRFTEMEAQRARGIATRVDNMARVARLLPASHEAQTEAIATLIKVMELPSDDAVRIAANGLGTIGAPAARSAKDLAKKFDSASYKTQHVIVDALGDMGPAAAEDSVPVLAKAAKNGCNSDDEAHANDPYDPVYVSIGAMEALAKLGPAAAPAIDELVHMADLAPYPQLQEEGMRALAALATSDDETVKDKAITSLSAHVGNENAEHSVRYAALSNLAAYKDHPKYVPALITGVQSENIGFARRVMKQLREMGKGAQDALPALETIRNNPVSEDATLRAGINSVKLYKQEIQTTIQAINGEMVSQEIDR